MRSMHNSDGGVLLLWNQIHTRQNVGKAIDTARQTLAGR